MLTRISSQRAPDGHTQIWVIREECAAVRVMVVEDHGLLAGLLHQRLTIEGFDVLVVDDLTCQGIVWAGAEFRPDVALLDYALGDFGTTLDAIAPLRDLDIAVVVLTGTTDERHLGACLAAGASATLSKSTSSDAIVTAIEAAAAGAPAMPESARTALVSRARELEAEEDERHRRFDALTNRERAVLRALVDGIAAERISAESYVSVGTVRTQIKSVLAKLGVRSQLEAVALARRAGWPGVDRTDGEVKT